MVLRNIKTLVLLIICVISNASAGYSQYYSEEQQIKVSLRKVGHEILLYSGDSTSLVLPIEKENNRYKITFGTEFSYDPDVIASIINEEFNEKSSRSSYLVEIEECNENVVTYSYEINKTIQPSEIACSGRMQPKACYDVYITFSESISSLDLSVLETPLQSDNLSHEGNNLNYPLILLICIPLIIFIGLFFKRRNNLLSNSKERSIAIGKYQFDKNNMTLVYENEKITLTGKEAELLYLFFSSSNTVLTREQILNIVWKDEGDYIGRTLDVFISKLRKKLSLDSNLKIINIHGVGYKFVVSG